MCPALEAFESREAAALFRGPPSLLLLGLANIRVNIRVNFENGGKKNSEKEKNEKKISRTEWIF